MRKIMMLIAFICLACESYAHVLTCTTLTDQNDVIWKTYDLPDSFYTQSISLVPENHEFIDRIYFDKGKSGAVVIYLKQEDEEKKNDLEQAGFSEKLDLRFSHAKNDSLVDDLDKLVDAELIPPKIYDYIIENKDKAVFSVLDFILLSGTANTSAMPDIPIGVYRAPVLLESDNNDDSSFDAMAELRQIMEMQRQFNLHY